MPFASSTIRTRRRAEVRRRDGGNPVCSLQLLPDCRAVGGEIDFDARPPHPRSFEVDHIVSSDEALRLGWSQAEADALDNCAAACRECNREKSAGASLRDVRPTFVNSRFV